MLSNISIYCQPFFWSSATEHKDVNFFSSVPYLSVGQSADLKDFLTEDSNEEISRDFQHIQEDATSSKYFHKASDFGITVTALKKIGTQTLYDFFRIFKDNTFVRYKVGVYYDNVLVFQGVIYPDGITYEDPEHEGGTDSSSKLIHLDVIGYEKEFAEYFKSKKLKPGSEIPFVNTFYDNGEQVKHINFITLLLRLFPGITINTPLHIADWNIVYDSTFHYASIRGLFFVPVGYVQIERSGTNCYEFLEKICNGMGWVFQFIYINGTPVLYINDLSSITTSIPTYTIPSDKIISIPSINSEGMQNLNKYICIPPHLDLTGGDNAFYGSSPNLQMNKALKGAHDIFISKDSVTELNGYHFSAVNSSGGGYSIGRSTNLQVMKYRSQDNNSKLYETLKWNGSSYNSSLTNIPHKDILALDTGHNTRFKRKVNLSDKSVTASDEGDTTIGDWHLVFSGCYAASLFKGQAVAGAMVNSQYSNLDTSKSYIHSSLFLNNMRALFNSFSKNYLEITFALDSLTIKQLLTNAVHYIQITGHENPDLNQKFVPLSSSINIFTDTITYKLIKK